MPTTITAAVARRHKAPFATYANVAESALVPVPKDVPLEFVGFLGCGLAQPSSR